MAAKRVTDREKKIIQSQGLKRAKRTVNARSEIGVNRIEDWQNLNMNRHRENDIRKEHPRKKTVTRGSKGVKRRGKA